MFCLINICIFLNFTLQKRKVNRHEKTHMDRRTRTPFCCHNLCFFKTGSRSRRRMHYHRCRCHLRSVEKITCPLLAPSTASQLCCHKSPLKGGERIVNHLLFYPLPDRIYVSVSAGAAFDGCNTVYLHHRLYAFAQRENLYTRPCKRRGR